MADHIGIGLIEQLLVDTMLELQTAREREARNSWERRPRSWEIVTALRDRHAIHPDHGYNALIGLGAKWLVPLRLVEHYGNFGSSDDGPANARHTMASALTRNVRAGGLGSSCGGSTPSVAFLCSDPGPFAALGSEEFGGACVGVAPAQVGLQVTGQYDVVRVV